MALQINLDTSFGVSFPQSYANINSIVVNCKSNVAGINVNYFTSQQARTDNATPIKTTSYQVSDTDTFNKYFADATLKQSGLTISQSAYAYLKTLSDFTGAIDC